MYTKAEILELRYRGYKWHQGTEYVKSTDYRYLVTIDPDDGLRYLYENTVPIASAETVFGLPL